MMSRHRRILLALSILGCSSGVGIACSSDRIAVPAAAPDGGSAPDAARGADDPQPHFLAAEDGAPTIANPVVTMWAKAGEDRRVRMYYHAAAGAADSSTFLEFRVGDRSLAAYPDGRAIAQGDSVLIAIRLVDPARLVVDCQPAGLRFSSKRPATLKMSYLHTDATPAVTNVLKIWRRESPFTPWVAQTSLVEVELHEVKTDIHGFSGYAIAY